MDADEGEVLVASKLPSYEVLEQSSMRWRRGLLIFSGLLVSFYCAWFTWIGSGISKDPEQWGQFGDFAGGLLNPVIAFCAFLWLARGVLLQKQEMREAYNALDASAKAQQKQIGLLTIQNDQLNNSAFVQERAYMVASIQAEIAILNQRIAEASAMRDLHHRNTQHALFWQGRCYSGAGPNYLGDLAWHIEQEIELCRVKQTELIAELSGLKESPVLRHPAANAEAVGIYRLIPQKAER